MRDDARKLKICLSFNISKAIIAVVQTTYASVILFKAREDQIERYRYASFGLTVIPYILMSTVNIFCGAILVPDYATVYLVHSLESDEAMETGGQIDGVVGRLVQRWGLSVGNNLNRWFQRPDWIDNQENQQFKSLGC